MLLDYFGNPGSSMYSSHNPSGTGNKQVNRLDTQLFIIHPNAHAIKQLVVNNYKSNQKNVMLFHEDEMHTLSKCC